MKPLAPLSLVILLAASGCGKAPPPSAGNQPQTVEVTPLKSDMVSTTLSLPAQLLPVNSVDVYPKVTGFIQDLPVDRGSVVRKGDLLVRLNAPELAAQKEQAVGALRAAEAKLIQDRATYERLANAAKTPGVVAQNDVDVAHQVATADAGQVASAQQSVRNFTELESYLTIRAPFDAVVTTLNLHPGALVGPASGQAGSQPILQLVTDKRLRLTVPVPEADAQDIKLGQLVSFTVPSAPGRTFQAPIARSAHALDTRTRTLMVELDVLNPNNEVRSGEFATVQWPVRRRYPTLLAPTTAVANDQQRQFVIAVADGKARWVDVTTGMSMDGHVEVFGKLEPNEVIVRRATDALQDGTRVRAVAAR